MNPKELPMFRTKGAGGVFGFGDDDAPVWTTGVRGTVPPIPPVTMWILPPTQVEDPLEVEGFDILKGGFK